MDSVLYSRNSDEWETPDEVFKKLNAEFNFTLDPCSDGHNSKCKKFYTKAEDGLKQNWGGETVFCNPPYSKIKDWIIKAYKESLKPNTVVVMLIPARTDTRWFHEYVYHRSEVRLIAKRIKFSNSKYNAPFPSMLVIYRSGGISA